MERCKTEPGVVAVAVLGAVLVWILWRAVGIVPAVGDGRPVTLVAVAVAAAVAAGGGVLTHRWLVRRRHGERRWLVLAAVVLMVSLAGPLGAVSVPAGLALASLHLVVAAVVTVGLTRLGRPSRAA